MQFRDRWYDLSFKVDREFRRNFRLAAASAGIPMKQILEESFAMWQREHPLDLAPAPVPETKEPTRSSPQVDVWEPL